MAEVRIEIDGGKLHIDLDDMLRSLTSENVKALCRSATWDEETVRGILSYMTTGNWPEDVAERVVA